MEGEGFDSSDDSQPHPPSRVSLSLLTLPRFSGRASKQFFAWKSHQDPTPGKVPIPSAGRPGGRKYTSAHG